MKEAKPKGTVLKQKKNVTTSTVHTGMIIADFKTYRSELYRI
jgi:hypothetical protein